MSLSLSESVCADSCIMERSSMPTTSGSFQILVFFFSFSTQYADKVHEKCTS